MNQDEAMAALKDCEQYKSLEPADLDTLLFLADKKRYAEGETIYIKGEPSNNTFCMIVSGTVNILTKDGKVARTVGRGHVIGEIALTDSRQMRTFTVEAGKTIEVLEWDVSYIKENMPAIWKKLLKLAWEHMSDLYED